MGDQVMIKVKIISDSGIYPEYETEGSAGMDIRAYIDEPVIIKPGERKLIPTGLRIKVGLVNLSDEDHVIENGDRIAQMVIAEYKRAVLEPAEDLEETERGSGGFGHTGTK